MLVSVISGKGGVGKTTTTANLSVALATIFKKRVLAVDCNFGSPDLPMHLGLYPYPKLAKRFEGGCIYNHSAGIDFMPTSAFRKLKRSSAKRIMKKWRYNLVIFDAPPINYDYVLKLSDMTLVVTNPEVTAVADALRAIKASAKHRVRVLGVEINRVKRGGHEVSPAELASIFDVPILSIVPESPRIPSSVLAGTPVVLKHPHCKSSVEFKRMAAMLAGKKYQPTWFEKLAGIFYK